jgi:hypothetical protein
MPDLNSPVEVVVIGGPSGAERRGTPRFASERLTLVRSNGSTKALARQAFARDVSARGICLQLDWQYLPGTILAVAPLGWIGPRVLVARVVRCREEGRHWIHGCELVDQLGDMELQHWRKCT